MRSVFLVLVMVLAGCGARWDYALEKGLQVQDYLGSETGEAQFELAFAVLEAAFGDKLPLDKIDIAMVSDANLCAADLPECIRSLNDGGIEVGPNTIVLPGDSPRWVPLLVEEVAKQVAKAQASIDADTVRGAAERIKLALIE